MPDHRVHIHLSVKIPREFAGKRLDQVMGILFSDHSRSRMQAWIKAGFVTVDGDFLRGKDKVAADQTIVINANAAAQVESQPQSIPLDIIYEDQDLVVINKPVGLVVHPGAGNVDNTLLNALLYHYPELQSVPRAGIVHRLDKDTSGLLVIARNLRTHTRLVSALQRRRIKREYQAVVWGVMTAGGTIDQPIGRHPTKRTLMAVLESGRPAVTHYRVLERFKAHTLLRVMLETGRTHQIRVHLSHIGYPIVGDATYVGRAKLPQNASEKLVTTLRNFKRQALHACKLTLKHPGSGELMEWEAPLPDDMRDLLQVLRTE